MPSNNQGYQSIPATDASNGDARHQIEDVKHQPNRAKIFISSIVALALLGYFGSKLFLNKQAHGFRHSSNGNFLLASENEETALFYEDQLIDHFNLDKDYTGATYAHRYYKKSRHWKGPGYPIFVIMGGEDELDLPLLYPFVHEGLAKEFGAFILSPEHRFYGQSQPLGEDGEAENPSLDQLTKFLTPDQALADAVQLIQYIRDEIGCSHDRTSNEYCPVITVGGSYPGFLAVMLRFRFPDIIDIGYGSSAPLELYSQEADKDAYFDKVTEVADVASPGCSAAVRDTVFGVRDALLANFTSVLDAAAATGFCADSFPEYMRDIPEFISETVTYLVPAVFADFNMAFYPPGPKTALSRACTIFQDKSKTPIERLSNFFDLRGEVEYGSDHKPECFDLDLELPSGPHARIRGSDNSGTGGGFTGEIWEFQCCKDLVIGTGYSEESMFIPRPFSYKWHAKHCHERFPGVPVDPYRMVNQWHFDDLSHASRILFTNGLNDGWSTSSITETDNPNLAVINFPNGAHHSELSQTYPNPRDTPDIVAGYTKATKVLGDWLNEIYAVQNH